MAYPTFDTSQYDNDWFNFSAGLAGRSQHPAAKGTSSTYNPTMQNAIDRYSNPTTQLTAPQLFEQQRQAMLPVQNQTAATFGTNTNISTGGLAAGLAKNAWKSLWGTSGQTIDNDEILKQGISPLARQNMEVLAEAEAAKKMGINPLDGSALRQGSEGIFGKLGSFAGSEKGQALGAGLMGAAKLGLGLMSYRQTAKMNKELLKDMKINRQNLAADRARAADYREKFAGMMNTL